jgi:hypothetical protein
MEGSDFAFFEFNGDFIPPPNNNRGRDSLRALLRDFKPYTDAEDDLEAMLLDNIIEIMVDDCGLFHYHPSKASIDAIHGMSGFEKLAPKSCTFADMLFRRGLNINNYNRFKSLLRKLSK